MSTPGDHDPTMSDSQRLVRIETLLLGFANSQADHETRLRRLEKILWVGIGFASATGSAVGSYVSNLPS